jgi:DtxR family transcriptional regulator, Mn-dependent transcriptional regulator
MTIRSEVLGESLEDYAEIILELEQKDGSARVTDIAQKMMVSKPSVTEALRLLKEREIVTYAPYSYIHLTEKGRILAQEVRRRHDILSSFLTTILGIPKRKAETQACRMEHILEPSTIEKLCKLHSFLTASFKDPLAEMNKSSGTMRRKK